MDKTRFKPGYKVLYKEKVYDFGYHGEAGKAILYEKGDCNGQGSMAVDYEDLILVNSQSWLGKKSEKVDKRKISKIRLNLYIQEDYSKLLGEILIKKKCVASELIEALILDYHSKNILPEKQAKYKKYLELKAEFEHMEEAQ